MTKYIAFLGHTPSVSGSQKYVIFEDNRTIDQLTGQLLADGYLKVIVYQTANNIPLVVFQHQVLSILRDA